MFRKLIFILLFASQAFAEEAKLERVGGHFKVKKIEAAKNGGFLVKFANEEGGAIKEINLESDHIHVGIKEGDSIRLSAEIASTKNGVAQASQVVLFMPSSSGPNPIWLGAKGTKFNVEKDFLKMHSPATDFLVL